MTDQIEARLQERGLVLPKPMRVPTGLALPFSWVKVVDHRAVLSGHLPLNTDGSVHEVKGKVGANVTVAQGYEAARLCALSMLGTLKRELGRLDRITNWVKVLGMVNTASGFNDTTLVINGCSELLIDIFGDQVGSHTRSAVGFAEIPLDCPVEIEAEVEIEA